MVNKAFQAQAWIDNILFLLMVLCLFGYVIYRGWPHFHLQ